MSKLNVITIVTLTESSLSKLYQVNSPRIGILSDTGTVYIYKTLITMRYMPHSP